MVVFVVNLIYVLVGTGERNAPVAAHLDGPRALSLATQFVEFQSGQVHIARACRRVQTAKDQAKPVGVFRLNPRFRASGEEPFDSFVPKPLDRHSDQRNLCRYRLQSA